MADSITIVLDPGHGGENHGLEYDGFLEKYMNLTVAQEMKSELEKYEGVTVYITNPECKDMSLKQRAEYAKSVEADLLVSLHFNMSEAHQMYGSEVWVPSAGENHSWMHTLGDIFLEELTGQGFLSRGVKTRLNGKGLDYYGILRESTALGVPSILVEHCYADAEEDASYLKQSESLHNFAVGDATAVAKFYGLHSESLGKDYSNYVKNAYFVPEGVVAPDETAPENVTLTYVNNESVNERASFLLQAQENESELCYYDYSLDGGEHWSELNTWTSEGTMIRFEVDEMPTDAKVIARVYNGHFLESESNTICFIETEERVDPDEEKQTTDGLIETEKVPEEIARAHQYKGVGFVSMAATILIVLVLLERMLRHNKKYVLRICAAAVGTAFICAVTLTISNQMIKRATEETAAESELEQMKDETLTVMSSHVVNEEANQITEQEATLVLEQDAALPKRETVYDIVRGYLSVESVEGMTYNSYDFSRVIEKNGYKYYTDITGAIQSEIGIDISKFQGDVDWQKVKESGIDFAMLRLGVRGYGSGRLVMDDKFYVNLSGAHEQGLRVGVYFFSAAISEEEAIEEADYVAQALEGYDIQMPVVFDTEPIYYDDSRTDELTPDKLTAIVRAFCDRIKEHGYTPMIYANAKRLTCMLHLERLSDIALWYADYQEAPIYPYEYQMWQYTEHGSVDGIDGEVDLNVYFGM